MTSAAAAIDDVFGALADGTRRRVLTLVAEQGSGTATTIAKELPVSRPAVIKHLTVLEGAGLVSSAKHGREVRFTVEPQRLTDAADWLTRRAHDWDRRLAALKRLAESAA